MHIRLSFVFPVAATYLLLSCPGCRDKGNVGAKESPAVHLRVDFSNQGDFIVLPVAIGKQNFNFILDTGSNIVVIDDDLKPLVGKVIKKDIAPFNLVEQEIRIDAMELSDPLVVGGTISFTGPVGMCDLSTFGIVGYDGVIGMEVLRHFILVLNFESGCIELTNNKKIAAQIENMYSVKLLLKNGCPFVNLRLEEKEEQFLIDTGLPGTSFLRKDVFNSIAQKNTVKEVTLDTVEGKQVGQAMCVDDIYFGQSSYSNVVFISHNVSVIGLHFLKQHKKVIFDFDNQTMYLLPIDKRMPPDLSSAETRASSL